MDWEIVCQSHGVDFTERLPVPGGWLYSRMIHDNVSLVFVPDEKPEAVTNE